MTKGRLFFLFVLFIFSASPVLATEKDEQVYVVQKKVFSRDHELGINLGYAADDDFYNLYPVGLSYTYNFNDTLSWEVGRIQMLISREKDLRKDLEKDFGVTPSEFTQSKYLFHSSALIRPFYGKESVFNKNIINHESYFTAGAGIINFEKKRSDGSANTENALSLSFGWGTKYFVGRKFCVNIEIRDFVNFKPGRRENYIYLGIGVGYRFNATSGADEQSDSTRKIKRYLGK